MTLPSVSWRDRPTTAVITVEVAMRPERLSPAREPRTNTMTTEAAATKTSRRMRGLRRPARGSATAKRKQAVTSMAARIPNMRAVMWSSEWDENS
jgi:hypothetical protein